MTDLRTGYLGLDLRTPIVASSSPLTSTLDGVRALEDAGVAAVVLPSLFEEQLLHEATALDELFWLGHGTSAEADGYFPQLDDYNSGPDRYLRIVEDTKVRRRRARRGPTRRRGFRGRAPTGTGW